MNLGYSLLLRELVESTSVDYGDCEDFQITCPACHEAIFKSGALESGRQYFSHYAASKSDVAECELRVAAISADQEQSINDVGHGQTMEGFYRRFREPVLYWLYGDDTPPAMAITRSVIRPSFIRLHESTRRAGKGAWSGPPSPARELARLELLRSFRSRYSAYWIKRQGQFALDFTNHLYAPNSSSAFAFFFYLAIRESSKVHLSIVECSERELLRGMRKTSKEDLRSFAVNMSVALHVMLHFIPYRDILAHKPSRKNLQNFHEYMSNSPRYSETTITMT